MREAPKRVLVHAPNWVGDAVMATPALRALRMAHPEARIVVEGPSYLRGLLSGLDTIDEFIADPGGGIRNTVHRVRNMRARRFNWAILLPDSPRTALSPFLARIPVRIGYARDVVRRTLLTHALHPPRHGTRRVPIPMVDRYLRITTVLGCPNPGHRLELRVSEEARLEVDRLLQDRGVRPTRELLVVTPGASWGASKLWPPDHFARACDGITGMLDLLPVIAPAPAEVSIAEAIVSQMKAEAVALVDPPTTLEQLKALIARATLVLTNDTGPRHIALAFDRPTIALMGPTDPRHTAYRLEIQKVLREEVDCSPCNLKTCPTDHRCMTLLHPDRVILAAEELLS